MISCTFFRLDKSGSSIANYEETLNLSDQPHELVGFRLFPGAVFSILKVTDKCIRSWPSFK